MDFILYLASMAFFIYMMYKRVKDESKKPAGREGDKDPLTQFLEGLDEDEVVVKKAPPHLPKKKAKPKFTPAPLPARTASNESIEERFSGHSVVSRHYQELENASPAEVTIKAKPSRAQRLLRGLKSKQQMIIYAELIGKPKASLF